MIFWDGSEGIGTGSIGSRKRGKRERGTCHLVWMTMGRKRKGGEGRFFHPQKELLPDAKVIFLKEDTPTAVFLLEETKGHLGKWPSIFGYKLTK